MNKTCYFQGAYERDILFKIIFLSKLITKPCYKYADDSNLYLNF